ncbi:MAG: hypothetical protein COB85_08225 [Bacteroidetes bacterium]|nr:MAG: hypothetical protein COB85_08225 [Bacteroidota bacterium]
MAEYYITKVKYDDSNSKIEVHYGVDKEGNKFEYNNDELRQMMQGGTSFATATKKPNGEWRYLNGVILTQNSGRQTVGRVPLELTKRKTFVSLYNKDLNYKDEFENLFGDIITNKSVGEDDIAGENSDEYTKQLIQNGYLEDTTVLIVLVGPKTKCRMHVDWEISGALNLKVGDLYAGLIGLLLPNHPDYKTGKVNNANLPKRLAKNVDSGYANIYDWTEDRLSMQGYIEDAFVARKERADERVNAAITQMEEDECE